MIIMDSSWDKHGGIGRFYNEISVRLKEIKIVKFTSKPASPFACMINTLKCLFLYNHNDCVFFPGYIPPFFSRCPFIFTIHDLNHIDRLENQTVLKRFFYDKIILRGCHKAKYIFTVSEYSRGRILEWSGVSPDKVINVGNGVDERYNSNVIPYPFEGKYLLSVSNRKIHKNEFRIIESFGLAEIDAHIKLFFTGHSNNELEDFINGKGLRERVIFLGYIDEKDLPSLYKGAEALLFPSLYEGFGLPVIESMACGTPVLTSTTTCLPEIADNCAILVNPESVSEIKSGIEKLVNNEELRKDLISKGYARAALYTWTNVVNKVAGSLGIK
ncbi:glycosyltransferase family 4 protein [Kosakonia oryzae]|uniref:Glycosyltransferase family 4 protein n=1 Tax=Kosakonia oryzae TaxID=497725 RepID=A0AA94KQE4_9ENTR|nr:glycosyltransferase family 1 protein [Kosakonia oryzae]ANI82288.1 glycosyltransferase family 4 protein [Kosakonia oryzae]SFC53421.1 Glycosyltransferase involved in cell wall bisynthesis [Kosakonia oryzae]